jgi:imidazolonepropionase-like amidohydrolase
MRAAPLALVALLFAVPAPADDAPRAAVVLRVGTLHVGDGKTMPNALIVVEGGKFTVAGEGAVPVGAVVRDLAAAHAAPGFVDAFTRLGVQGGAAEDVEALTPGVRAADAFDAKSPQLADLAANGTTVVGFGPAAANVAAGCGGAARLTASGAIVIDAAGPPVFAFVPPALRFDRAPATLAGARRLLEKAFAGKSWREAGDMALPISGGAIKALHALPPGRAVAWADSPASATAAVETLRAKQLDPVLVGLRECAAEPDALVGLVAPCAVTALRPEDPLAMLALPARLHAKGVPVAITTSAPDRSPRSLRLALSLAVAAGLPPEAAVATVTSAPAKMLGLDGRIGRVAPGLDADLVVFDGPPWEVRSRILLVLSGGDVVLDRAPVVAEASR